MNFQMDHDLSVKESNTMKEHEDKIESFFFNFLSEEDILRDMWQKNYDKMNKMNVLIKFNVLQYKNSIKTGNLRQISLQQIR